MRPCQAQSGEACRKPARGPCSCHVGDEYRAEMSLKAQRQWQDDEARARKGAQSRAFWSDPARRRQQAERLNATRRANGLFGWTPDLEDQLRRLWDKGLSAGQCAAKLGTSRNSIIGKVHRLGLAARAVGVKRKIQTRPAHAPGLAHAEMIRAMSAQNRCDGDIAAETGLRVRQVQYARRLLAIGKPIGRKPAAPARRVNTSELGAGLTGPLVERIFADGYRGQTGRVAIWDLEPHHCRFPVDMAGEALPRYCGLDATEAGYCADHAARCFTGIPAPKQVLPTPIARR